MTRDASRQFQQADVPSSFQCSGVVWSMISADMGVNREIDHLPPPIIAYTENLTRVFRYCGYARLWFFDEGVDGHEYPPPPPCSPQAELAMLLSLGSTLLLGPSEVYCFFTCLVPPHSHSGNRRGAENHGRRTSMLLLPTICLPRHLKLVGMPRLSWTCKTALRTPGTCDFMRYIVWGLGGFGQRVASIPNQGRARGGAHRIS